MDINKLGKIPQSIYARIASLGKIEHVPLVISPQVTDQALKEEGKNEQKINIATKKEEDKQLVNDLIKKSNRCIISISTHFPWTLLPNTIQVEESRVTFIFRQLLGSQSHSVDIKDISNVFIESSPFFATLQIVSRTYIQNDIMIGHLNVKRAHHVQAVIEGLRTFAEHNIDTSNYEVKELIAKIEEFQKNKKI
ncbi:MAG: hypothetical protein WAV51_01100 [Microgenomates group bacterium]